MPMSMRHFVDNLMSLYNTNPWTIICMYIHTHNMHTVMIVYVSRLEHFRAIAAVPVDSPGVGSASIEHPKAACTHTISAWITVCWITRLLIQSVKYDNTGTHSEEESTQFGLQNKNQGRLSKSAWIAVLNYITPIVYTVVHSSQHISVVKKSTWEGNVHLSECQKCIKRNYCRWSDPVSKAQSKSWSHSTTNLAQWCDSWWQPSQMRKGKDEHSPHVACIIVDVMVCINSSLL